MNKYISASLLSAIALLSTQATAEWYGTARLGIDFGGGQLDKSYFFTADSDPEDPTFSGYEEIKGGGQWSAALGTGYRLSEKSTIETSIGYKFDFATSDAGGSASNISESDHGFHRYPLEVAFYRQLKNKVRAGIGASYHLGVRYEGERQFNFVDEVKTELDFDDSLGFYGEIAYKATENTYVGLRYTAIDYDETITGNTLSGNSVGFSAVYQY